MSSYIFPVLPGRWADQVKCNTEERWRKDQTNTVNDLDLVSLNGIVISEKDMLQFS